MDDELEGSQKTRIDKLWALLDSKGTGRIDVKALQAGLRKIDHPLQHADGLLHQVIRVVDTNDDGHIEHDEFCRFIEQAEIRLWVLFKSIDRNQDNRLSKTELKEAFQRSEISVGDSRLDELFTRVDSKGDGEITFDEWRDFLLFMPAKDPGLRAILSYFSAGVKVNAEGDVTVNDETIESLGYFLAGAIAGIVSRTSTAPLDRLKVYLINQTEAASKAVEAAKHGSPLQATKHAATPLVNAMRDLWAAGGVRSLFAGNGLNVIKVMPESAIKFGSYEAAKRFIARLEGHNDPKKLHSISSFLAGGIGGIISQACVYPIDTLKFRMQSETVKGGLHGNALIVETGKTMWAQGGYRAFYRGLTMGVVGMFPYAAIDLGTFELVKKTYIARNVKRYNISPEDAAPGAVATAAIGGASGALGASIVYPLNLLRTRLQTQGTKAHPRTYTGIRDVWQQTVKGEGYRGLFKGLTPNLLKVVPAVSITYVVYEHTKKVMNLH